MQNTIKLQEKYLEGIILLIDKPYQWTSFDAVNKIKSMLRYLQGIKKIKIGHAGTLDPLATGLLIICTGKATKRISELQILNKTYTGTFHLGQTTPSYDLETVPDNDYPINHLTENSVLEAARSFIGDQEQVPPLYSAKKINGRRAYKHARKGSDAVLKAQKINIEAFDITRIAIPETDFRIVCSKGTYIRAIARDFGERLGSGAYLKSLNRTNVGGYSLSDAISLTDLEARIRHETER